LNPRFPGPSIGQPILPERRLFYRNALSVIATILPSEKAVKKAANVLEGLKLPKMPALIDLWRIPVQK